MNCTCMVESVLMKLPGNLQQSFFAPSGVYITLIVVNAAQVAIDVGMLTTPVSAYSPTAFAKSITSPPPIPTTSSQFSALHFSAYSLAAGKWKK